MPFCNSLLFVIQWIGIDKKVMLIIIRSTERKNIRMKMQLSEIARALEIEAKETWEDITITSVSFDSRQLEPGALFVPLIGEQDGHRYVQAALDNGASAVLWQADHPETPTAIPALVVEDTLVALQALGRYYLQK